MSARAEVTDALARIARDDTGAVVTVSPHALAEAGRVDAADTPGPLAGVPFTAKDVLATAGLRTTAGSRALQAHIPEHDAPAVALLRQAGAVLVGKTNCSELALSAWTGNAVFPPTRHPTRPGRSPGGSSGGCAAAVAAGLVPLSLGTDYGGSIRFPAASCGVIGLRPTAGRVPAGGQLPPADPDSPRARFSVVGPLGRTVADVRAAFAVLAGATTAARAPAHALLLADGPAGDQVRRAGAALAADGVSVRHDALPWLREAAQTFSDLRALDTYDDLRQLLGDLGPALQALVRSAPTHPDPATRRRLDDRCAALLDRALTDLDAHGLLVLPIADGPVPAAAGRAPDLELLWPARAISLLGLPAVAVGGVQLVGGPGDDEAVLAAAAVVERRLPATVRIRTP